jgi:hypothetical protein
MRMKVRNAVGIHIFQTKKGLRYSSKPLILLLAILPGFKPGVPAL